MKTCQVRADNKLSTVKKSIFLGVRETSQGKPPKNMSKGRQEKSICESSLSSSEIQFLGCKHKMPGVNLNNE